MPSARRRRALPLLGLAISLCLMGLLASCGINNVPLGHSGPSVAQPPTAAQVCRSHGIDNAYQPGDAVQFNPYLKCVMDGLIADIYAGTASVAYLVETFKNCNPDGQQAVAGWTLYQQDPLHPEVTATPGKFTGVGATAPLYTANSPTRKGCFTGFTSVIKQLVGVTLPGNVTLDQLRAGVLIFNEGIHMSDPTPFNHPSMIVSISDHLSHCPCDIQRLDLLPGDPAFLGAPGNPGRIAMEARITYLAA
jgi:hypothetical protein